MNTSVVENNYIHHLRRHSYERTDEKHIHQPSFSSSPSRDKSKNLRPTYSIMDLDSLCNSMPSAQQRPTCEDSNTAPATPEPQEALPCQLSSLVNNTPHTHSQSKRSKGTNFSTRQSLKNQTDFNASYKNTSGYTAESVLQKFRKSFSLRFYKKGGGGNSKEEGMLPESHSPDTWSTPPLCKGGSLDKYRFGPLVWRSSKERQKSKQSARETKCNSGDSGIQVEVVGRGRDSSCDTEILDSPPLLRRRDTSSSIESKPSRPTSDVISQVLIDKLRADLQMRALPKHSRHSQIHRTLSDGQRLWRMLSTPSPKRMKPPFTLKRTTLDVLHKRSSGSLHQLRRSVSQPLGINELSPLMRRKPSGSGRINVVSEDERGVVSDDDELLSDSESSLASLTDKKKTFEQVIDDDMVILAEAVWDHVAMEPEELAFHAGEVIEVLDTLDRDWWWGARGDQAGWFPSAFVRLRVSQEDTVEDCLAAIASGCSKQLRRRTSISLLSNDQVRSRVVRELVNTERDFVKVLRDVKEGYLTECKKRTDMFSNEQIKTIFGNLEELLAFQEEFLEDLEKHVDVEAPHTSCVGDIFLKHKAGFRKYSEYCNSHPMAIATLQELYQHNNYSKFFEACRLMRGLIEIPLDGYLLTPVQRICKYPLQLAELLKYTKTDHPDFTKITEALEAMRGVAVLINERKRRMESLEKLEVWQQRVDGWEGEDLIETSSQLIHQGEAIRVTSGMWTNNITLFLFDHQLIYCKKDILKRNTFVYKGRIHLDTSEVIDLPDGKESTLGVTVRHGIKVCTTERNKWLLFCCRSAQDKVKWLEGFVKERKLVEQDLKDGLEFAPAARHLARIAATRCRRPPSKPTSKAYKRGSSDLSISESLREGSVQRSSGTSHSLGHRMGTWFTFGGNKKSRHLGRGSTLQPVVHPS